MIFLFLNMIRFQRLNMDNSWHIQVGSQSILIDPWLGGVEVDFFKWFNMQWHRTPPLPIEQLPAYDWVVITQKYPDHFHAETLRLLKPKRIIAPKSIRKQLSAVVPDATIHYVEHTNERIELGDVVLQWFHTSRKMDPIYDAMALHDGKEAVMVATHGFDFSKEQHHLLRSLPPVKLLLSPITFYKLPFFLGGVVSPGMKGLQNLLRDTQAEKFVSTHDEDKHAKGLVSRMANVIRYSVEDIFNHQELGSKFINIADYQPQSL